MKLSLVGKIIKLLKSRAEEKFTSHQIAELIVENYPEESEKKRQRTMPGASNNQLIQQFTAEVGSSFSTSKKRDPQIKATEGRPRQYYYTEKTDQREVKQAKTANVVASSAKLKEHDAKVRSRFSTSKKRDPQIKVTEERPQQYYYTEKTDQMEVKQTKAANATSSSEKIKEHELYSTLISFLQSEFGICSKRINEKRSSNKESRGSNKWLYPDLVAMENLTVDWDETVKNCVWQHSDKKAKLWSFEVKVSINRSNVRQYFFQAVSNSSWANYGYLVAANLESNARKELQMLASWHGIGFILLNKETPSKSQILIPAKERADINWGAVNRLLQENSDSRDFIKEVIKFYQTGETTPHAWD